MELYREVGWRVLWSRACGSVALCIRGSNDAVSGGGCTIFWRLAVFATGNGGVHCASIGDKLWVEV